MRPLTTTALVRGFENGADYWRLVEPFTLARECGHDCYAAVRGKPLTHPPDILVFRGEFFKTDGPWSWSGFLAQCEADKVLVVLDYDDAYQEWDKYRDDQAQVDACKAAAQHAHLVTTTTHRLAQEIADFAGRYDVAVVENAIRLESWRHLSPPDPEHPLIVVAGGDSHGKDWEQVPDIFRAIARQHPTVHFRVAGYDPGWGPDLKSDLGDRIELRTFERFAEYPRSAFQAASLVLAPLADSVFNRNRSPIRHWEATAAGAAFIGSPILYHQSVMQGETGILCSDTDSYVDFSLALLADETRRSRMVSLARQHVRDHALTPDAVNARFDLYYRAWQARYNPDGRLSDGTSAISSLWTPESARGGADSKPGYRPVLDRDGDGRKRGLRIVTPTRRDAAIRGGGRQQPVQ